MSIPVETLSYVGVMAVMIGLMWKLYDKITNKHNADVKEILSECTKIQTRITVVETKQDIYLHAAGFDIREINAEIKTHMDEIEDIKKNGGTSIGCINVDKLKRRQT